MPGSLPEGHFRTGRGGADRTARLGWSARLWRLRHGPAAASRDQTLRTSSQQGQAVDNHLRYQADSRCRASRDGSRHCDLDVRLETVTRDVTSSGTRDLRPRPPARRRRRRVPDRAGPEHAAAARPRPGQLPGPGRHDARDPRLRQAGRRLRLHQGQGPQRADRHGVHPDRGAGDRRRPAAAGCGQVRPRRGHAGDPGRAHGPGGRRRRARSGRAVAGARGLGVLRPRRHRRPPPRWRALLDHRPDGCRGQEGDRRDRPRRLDADPLSAGGLGRRGLLLDLRRRGSQTLVPPPQGVWDDEGCCWTPDAEAAETSFTAFTSRRRCDHISARLIVRRVKRLNPASVPAGQGELFGAYRHHAVFTDSPEPTLAAETTHRQHAIIEQVHADLKAGPLAHLPSGSFAANSAWLVLATIAFNLIRAAGALASAAPAKATTATIRSQLIAVPARIARSARRLRLHLPRDWPWETAWTRLFDATCGPPVAA